MVLNINDDNNPLTYEKMGNLLWGDFDQYVYDNLRSVKKAVNQILKSDNIPWRVEADGGYCLKRIQTRD